MALREQSSEKRTFSDITVVGEQTYNGKTSFDATASGFANPIGDGRVAMSVSLSVKDLTDLCAAAVKAKHQVLRLSVFQIARRASAPAETAAPQA